jgi:hypothetical protein
MITGLYLFIFTVSWLATPIEEQVIDKNTPIPKAEILRDIILAVLGSNENFRTKPILVVGHFGVIMQLICHVPLMFFIGKEHLLTCIDEHFNNSLSLMLNRIKNSQYGDPRYYLVERKYNLRNSIIESETSEEVVRRYSSLAKFSP